MLSESDPGDSQATEEQQLLLQPEASSSLNGVPLNAVDSVVVTAAAKLMPSVASRNNGGSTNLSPVSRLPPVSSRGVRLNAVSSQGINAAGNLLRPMEFGPMSKRKRNEMMFQGSASQLPGFRMFDEAKSGRFDQLKAMKVCANEYSRYVESQVNASVQNRNDGNSNRANDKSTRNLENKTPSLRSVHNAKPSKYDNDAKNGADNYCNQADPCPEKLLEDEGPTRGGISVNGRCYVLCATIGKGGSAEVFRVQAFPTEAEERQAMNQDYSSIGPDADRLDSDSDWNANSHRVEAQPNGAAIDNVTDDADVVANENSHSMNPTRGAIPGEMYALKIVFARSQEEFDQFFNEVELLNRCQGQGNVIQILDFETNPRCFGIFMVMELASEGDLFHYLKDHAESLRLCGDPYRVIEESHAVNTVDIKVTPPQEGMAVEVTVSPCQQDEARVSRREPVGADMASADKSDEKIVEIMTSGSSVVETPTNNTDGIEGTTFETSTNDVMSKSIAESSRLIQSMQLLPLSKSHVGPKSDQNHKADQTSIAPPGNCRGVGKQSAIGSTSAEKNQSSSPGGGSPSDSAVVSFRKEKISLEEFDNRCISVLSLFAQALNGVRSLHLKNIIHSDLKPANFLVCGEDFALINGKPVPKAFGLEADPNAHIIRCAAVKVADLGLAAIVREGESHVTRGNLIGTQQFMAPEAIFRMNEGIETDDAEGDEAKDDETESPELFGKVGEILKDEMLKQAAMKEEEPRFDKTKIRYASDVWSMGVILFLMMYQRTPYAHLRRLGHCLWMVMLDESVAIQFQPGMLGNHSQEFERLVQICRGCLQHKPSERWNLERISEEINRDLTKKPYDMKLSPTLQVRGTGTLVELKAQGKTHVLPAAALGAPSLVTAGKSETQSASESKSVTQSNTAVPIAAPASTTATSVTPFSASRKQRPKTCCNCCSVKLAMYLVVVSVCVIGLFFGAVYGVAPLVGSNGPGKPALRENEKKPVDGPSEAQGNSFLKGETPLENENPLDGISDSAPTNTNSRQKSGSLSTSPDAQEDTIVGELSFLKPVANISNVNEWSNRKTKIITAITGTIGLIAAAVGGLWAIFGSEKEERPTVTGNALGPAAASNSYRPDEVPALISDVSRGTTNVFGNSLDPLRENAPLSADQPVNRPFVSGMPLMSNPSDSNDPSGTTTPITAPAPAAAYSDPTTMSSSENHRSSAQELPMFVCPPAANFPTEVETLKETEIQPRSVPRVVLLGETGSGKSRIVERLTDISGLSYSGWDSWTFFANTYDVRADSPGSDGSITKFSLGARLFQLVDTPQWPSDSLLLDRMSLRFKREIMEALTAHPLSLIVLVVSAKRAVRDATSLLINGGLTDLEKRYPGILSIYVTYNDINPLSKSVRHKLNQLLYHRGNNREGNAINSVPRSSEEQPMRVFVGGFDVSAQYLRSELLRLMLPKPVTIECLPPRFFQNREVPDEQHQLEQIDIESRELEQEETHRVILLGDSGNGKEIIFENLTGMKSRMSNANDETEEMSGRILISKSSTGLRFLIQDTPPIQSTGVWPVHPVDGLEVMASLVTGPLYAVMLVVTAKNHESVWDVSESYLVGRSFELFHQSAIRREGGRFIMAIIRPEGWTDEVREKEMQNLKESWNRSRKSRKLPGFESWPDLIFADSKGDFQESVLTKSKRDTVPYYPKETSWHHDSWILSLKKALNLDGLGGLLSEVQTQTDKLLRLQRDFLKFYINDEAVSEKDAEAKKRTDRRLFRDIRLELVEKYRADMERDVSEYKAQLENAYDAVRFRLSDSSTDDRKVQERIPILIDNHVATVRALLSEASRWIERIEKEDMRQEGDPSPLFSQDPRYRLRDEMPPARRIFIDGETSIDLAFGEAFSPEHQKDLQIMTQNLIKYFEENNSAGDLRLAKTALRLPSDPELVKDHVDEFVKIFNGGAATFESLHDRRTVERSLLFDSSSGQRNKRRHFIDAEIENGQLALLAATSAPSKFIKHGCYLALFSRGVHFPSALGDLIKLAVTADTHSWRGMSLDFPAAFLAGAEALYGQQLFFEAVSELNLAEMWEAVSSGAIPLGRSVLSVIDGPNEWYRRESETLYLHPQEVDLVSYLYHDLSTQWFAWLLNQFELDESQPHGSSRYISAGLPLYLFTAREQLMQGASFDSDIKLTSLGVEKRTRGGGVKSDLKAFDSIGIPDGTTRKAVSGSTQFESALVQLAKLSDSATPVISLVKMFLCSVACFSLCKLRCDRGRIPGGQSRVNKVP